MAILDTRLEMRRIDQASYKSRMSALQAKVRQLEKQQTEADPQLLTKIANHSETTEYLSAILDFLNLLEELPPSTEDVGPDDIPGAEPDFTSLSPKQRKIVAKFNNEVGEEGDASTGAAAWELMLNRELPYRQWLLKMNMLVTVYPDKIVIRGAIPCGQSNITPAYKLRHYRTTVTSH